MKSEPVMRPLPSVPDLLHLSLQAWDACYDPAVGLVAVAARDPGYHTRMRPGQRVHPTKESADYAHLLLLRNGPGDTARAEAILDVLLDLQVTDPTSIHAGIWGWYAEEPPAAMAPADWNWADFLGARLTEILVAAEHRLDPRRAARVRQALVHATRAILVRDIGPWYTNICAMGAAVCLGAGRLLGDADLVAYGRRRIAAQRAACEVNGGVPEYNSPHYTTILIQELERILRLSDDVEARRHAEWLRQRMWALLTSQIHPGTGQWAGAQGRVYHDLLQPEYALFLWQRTGIPLLGVAAMTFRAGPDELQDLASVPCPSDLLPRLAALPAEPLEVRQTWMPATEREPARILTTWFSHAATLGSVNQSTTWVQHRPITGYWRTPAGVASLRLHLRKDGRDFASGLLRTVQSGPRLLTLVGLAVDQGDWHCSLDRPQDGTFLVGDLRLRLALTGPGAVVEALPDGRWSLAAGDHRVVVGPPQGRFDGQPVTAWIAGTDATGVFLEVPLHHGPARHLTPRTVGETGIAVALEVLAPGEEPRNGIPQGPGEGESQRWTCTGIPGVLQAPRHPVG